MDQHQLFDRFAKQWLSGYQAAGKTIYCQAGCSGCCSMAVHATYPEAVAIADQLSPSQDNQLAAYMARLKNAMPRLSDMKSYLQNHRPLVGPCPFLDSRGSCSVYSNRPLSCRALLSTRPSDWCTVDLSRLDPWDKMVYEEGLDRDVVAWPTHYVASTRDLGLELETQILGMMRSEQGWSLSGNLAVMVWLERNFHLYEQEQVTRDQLQNLLDANDIGCSLLLDLQVPETRDNG